MSLKKTALLLSITFFSLISTNANTKSDSLKNNPESIFKLKNTRDYTNKGKFFVHWGYNFSWYGKSDLHMYGEGYDFTLHDVKAKDRPTELSITYIDPAKITIPQFNFHFGYFIKDNYSVSLGWDHMKYVVTVPQTVKISGYIDSEISSPSIPTGAYAGTYNKDEILIDKDFLTFEHTDGYNYVSIEIERYDDIWVSKSKKRSLSMETGLGLGLLVPRTDARLFGVGANHYWNIAGYGASAKVGARYFFNKRLYLQGSMKTGWTDLRNIRTTGRNSIDKAQQKISFIENFYVLGILI